MPADYLIMIILTAIYYRMSCIYVVENKILAYDMMAHENLAFV